MEGDNSIKLNLSSNSDKLADNEELSSLRSELVFTQEENTKLHSEISSLLKDMQNLRSQPNTAEEDLVVVQDENEQLRSQVVKMIKDLDSVQGELNKVQGDLEIAKEKVKEDGGKEEVKNLQKELSEILGELDLSKSENQKLRSQEGIQKEELSKVEADLLEVRKNFEKAKGEVEKIRSKEIEQTEELGKVQAELLGFRKDADLAKGEVEKLRSQEGEQTEELGKVQAELLGIRKDFDLAKGEVEKLRSQEGEQIEELGKVQAELLGVRKDFDLAKGEIKKLRSKEIEQTKESGRLQSELSEARKNFESVKGEVEGLRSQEGGKTAEYNKLEAELVGAREKFAAVKSDNDKLRSQEGVISEELSKMQVELNGVKDELDKQRAENKHLSSQGIDKGEEIVSLQTDLNSLRKELEETQSEDEQLSLVASDEGIKKLQAKLKDSNEALDLEKVQNETLSLQLDKQREEIETLDTKLNKILAEKSHTLSKKNSAEADEKIKSEGSEAEPIKDYGIKEDDTPTTRVRKLRKYRGYRNPEEKKESNQSLLELVQEYRERMASGETKEEIALSIAKLNPEKLNGDDSEDSSDDKSKAYSPNRSFGELLEDSERRKVALAPDDVEVGWSNDSEGVFLEGFKPEDIEPMPERANVKPLIIAAVIASVALVVAGVFLFTGGDDEPIVENNLVNPLEDEHVVEVNSETTDAVVTDEENQPLEDDVLAIDLTSDELQQQALELLRSFHATTELEQKAAFCRVPSRTLESMKSYYSDEVDAITISSLTLSNKLVALGELKLIKADVIAKIGDVVGPGIAFFEVDDEGGLKLDWFNSVDNEAKTWDPYTKGDDISLREWRVIINFNGDEHPDFAESHAALRIKSFSPKVINEVNAYLAKDNPLYQDLLDAYQTGQQVFILTLRNLVDGSGSFMIEDIVSLHSFYPSDLEGDNQ